MAKKWEEMSKAAQFIRDEYNPLFGRKMRRFALWNDMARNTLDDDLGLFEDSIKYEYEMDNPHSPSNPLISLS